MNSVTYILLGILMILTPVIEIIKKGDEDPLSAMFEFSLQKMMMMRFSVISGFGFIFLGCCIFYTGM